MAQYPSPYMPPNVTPYYGVPVEPLKAGKRASILMFIVGPFMMLCGGCALAMPSILPSLLAAMPPSQASEMQAQINQQMQNSQITPGMFAPLMIVQGTMILLPGLALVVLAFFVRKGGKVSAILSLVLVGLILFINVISLLLALVHPAAALGGACFDVISISIFVTLFLWLLQAAKASSTIKLAQQQYQAQYWQYQQNMQAYMGYGQQQQMPRQMPPAGYPYQGYAQAAPPPAQLPPTPQQPAPPQPDPNVPPPQG